MDVGVCPRKILLSTQWDEEVGNSCPASEEETAPIFLVRLSYMGSSSNCLKVESVKKIEVIFGYDLNIWKFEISFCKFANTFIWLNLSKRLLTKLSFEKYRLRIRNPLLTSHPSIMANDNTVISVASGKSIKPFHIFNPHFVFFEKSIPATNTCRCNPIIFEQTSLWEAC